jgi:hypothetical protein
MYRKIVAFAYHIFDLTPAEIALVESPAKS